MTKEEIKIKILQKKLEEATGKKVVLKEAHPYYKNTKFSEDEPWLKLEKQINEICEKYIELQFDIIVRKSKSRELISTTPTIEVKQALINVYRKYGGKDNEKGNRFKNKNSSKEIKRSIWDEK